jgi:phage shock protein C
MFCTQCGTQLGQSDRFCANCGKPQDAPAPVPVMAPAHGVCRPLRRVMRGKKIAGVCAGFADYFEVDVTLMRIIFLVLLVTPPGVGLIGYLIAWAAMPRDTDLVF